MDLFFSTISVFPSATWLLSSIFRQRDWGPLLLFVSYRANETLSAPTVSVIFSGLQALSLKDNCWTWIFWLTCTTLHSLSFEVPRWEETGHLRSACSLRKQTGMQQNDQERENGSGIVWRSYSTTWILVMHNNAFPGHCGPLRLNPSETCSAERWSLEWGGGARAVLVGFLFIFMIPLLIHQ